MKTLPSAPTFTSDHWITLSSAITESLRLTESEARAFFDSKTARLIGALPFLARCDQPERAALSHLATYWLSIKAPSRWVFDHAPDDDVDPLRRLACIADFQGGDGSLLGRGMQLLTLQMVCGYLRDQAKDEASGDYNPVLSGAWDGPRLKDALIAEILRLPSPEMDGIMSVHDAKRQWWA